MNKNPFQYKYTAPTEEERKEIASIRRQYESQKKSENKLERLRRLDGLVKNTATIVGLVLGVCGILLFGLGLSLILEFSIWLWGVIFCIVGGVPTLAAYPVYKTVLKKNKKKYGEEILRLSEELLGESEEK